MKYIYTIDRTLYNGTTYTIMYVSTLKKAEMYLKKYKENKGKYKYLYRCAYDIKKISLY